MRADVVFKDAHIVSADCIFRAHVAVQGETIHAVTDGEPPPGDRVIDCQGKVLIPGVIDPHTHPGIWYPYDEDGVTETQAAARGGVTTLLQFIRETKSYHENFPAKLATAEATFTVDFGYHFGIQSDAHVDEMADYARQYGVRSFKIYFGYDTNNPLGVVGADDGWLFQAMRNARQIKPKGWVCLHAENYHICRWLVPEVKGTGRNDLQAWSDARPAFCEESDIRKAVFFAKHTGCPLYIVHTTFGSTLPGLVTEAWREGVELVIETCPHYLLFGCENHPAGIQAKVMPAIRESREADALWEGIRRGFVKSIGSDHAPNFPHSKRGLDVWTEVMGFLGLESLLPIMISEGYHRRGIPLTRIVEICCKNPAQLFGLYPKKGAILPGSDADLVLVDLDREQAVPDRDKGVNVFRNIPFRGWPVLTMCRGRVVMENGVANGQPGWGQCVNVPG